MSKKHTTSELSLLINDIDINNKYQLLSKIGEGSYGVVWLVVPTNSHSIKSQTKQYVLKRINLNQSPHKLSQNEIEYAVNEAKLLSTLKHPNIVTYKESFRSNDGFINIVMAYCEGGDLYTILQAKKFKKEHLKENKILEWFIQICMALKYIHEKNILHRDLKTKNIFLTKDGIIKIGDLGIARELRSVNDFATTMVGTPHYMSPEIFSRKPYGQKSDIWALGCCVYEMATFDQIFTANDIDSLKDKIIIDQTPQIPKMYSDSLIAIVTLMLKKNPEERPTTAEILQDTFVKQHIARFLEKTQKESQNQVNSKSQPIIATPIVPSSSSSENRHTPILPSYSALPPSHSRPSSAVDDNRSLPHHHHTHRDTSLPMNDHEKHLKFLSKVSQNDTLQRRNRDLQFNKHQHPSSSDEQDASPHRSSSENSCQPHLAVDPSRRETRLNSAESDTNSPRSPSHSRLTKSSDLNSGSHSNARERRRAMKLHTSSTDDSVPNVSPNQTARDNESPRFPSQDNLIAEVEKKKEGEKDKNELVHLLTATLNLTPTNYLHSSRGVHTIPNPFQETSRLQKRYRLIREDCLQEITPNKLQRVLKILENVSEAQMMEEMMGELGEQLYKKYSAQIFLLQFYEDNLLVHS